jgi:hypothetical protein
MATEKETAKVELPPNVIAADLKYPESGKGVYSRLKELGLDATQLTFYKTTGFGWVLTTLGISNAGRAATARSYGITLDGKCCRVGRGPHVTATVSVYLSTDNWNRLLPYIELYRKGLAEAGTVRDRISTRRAQGQIHRANGETYWRW